MGQEQQTLQSITEAEAAEWIALYRKAWVEQDAGLVRAIFTPDVDYRERRFGDPMRGHTTLESYWRDRVFEHQRAIGFDYQIWAVRQNMCVFGWQASLEWLPINGLIEIDGVARTQFTRTPEGGLLCHRFEEWMDYREVR